MAQTSLATQRKRLFIILIAIVGIVLLVVWYFVAWRPSSQDYSDANNSLKVMSLVTQTFTDQKDGTFRVTNINRTIAARLGSQVSLFQGALYGIAGNRAVKHDHVVGGVLHDNKQSLENYTNSIDQFAGSLLIYQNVTEACSDLINGIAPNTGQADFLTLAKACQDMLDSHKTVPDKNFDTYYQSYRNGVETIIANYNAFFKAANANDAKAVVTTTVDTKNSIVALAGVISRATIKIPPFATPTTAIKALQSSLDSQKNAFFKW